MDSKSSTTADFLDKIRDVTESLKEEFNLTNNEDEYINTGPPPNMKRRRLIFDSMRTIIEGKQGTSKSSGGGGGGGDQSEDRGRYVYVFGAGYHGQLGRKAARGHKKYANVPIGVHLPSSIAVREISCGALHTAVVTDSGLVYTWGDGRMGQLGHLQEGFSNQPVPTLVSSLSGSSITHISCGQNHTVCIDDGGRVYSWGWAKYGQLGLGTRTNQRYPQMISDEIFLTKHIQQVSCGDRHSVAVATDGEIFTFGSGEHGQLGHGNNNDQYVPSQIESLATTKIVVSSCGSIHTAVLSDDGKLFIFGFGENLYGKQAGNFNYEPIAVSCGKHIKSVACGQSHILILTSSGDVYAWGDGSYGEIGQGAFKASQQPRLILLNKNIESIACGRYHSAAVTNNGSLYTWGCGDNGQLGRHTQSNNDNTMINIKKANSIPKLVVSLLGNVLGEISCGEHHTCVLASCRYKSLADDVFEYGKLEEVEFQSKLNLLSSSKQKGRGISKKDLVKIKKWRKEEEQRMRMKKENNKISENKKIQMELNKISTRKEIMLSSPQKLAAAAKKKEKEKETSSSTASPPQQQSSPALGKEEAMSPSKMPTVRKTKTSKQMTDSLSMNTMGGKGGDRGIGVEIGGIDAVGVDKEDGAGVGGTIAGMMAELSMLDEKGPSTRVTAKVANQNRASFHETTRNFLYGMASQIFGAQNQSASSSEASKVTAELAIKNKFAYRKDYDKLKLCGKLRELQLRKLDEDLAILQEVDDCSEIASQNAEMQLRKLGMKLNTVMIKISEAERSKRTYELNIVHIKDESQENHKQLDSLRRNLSLQLNLKKKISKFKDYALKQRDFAVLGLKEFSAELSDWHNFLDYQYRHLASLAKKDETPKGKDKDGGDGKENRKELKCDIKNNEKKAKKRQKAIQRINKLKKLVENNEREIAKLNEKLLQFEHDINFYDERFKRIYNATGLSSTDRIINKFFVNKEIKREQEQLLHDLYEELNAKESECESLEQRLKVLHSNNNDHTWREIDILQEALQKKKHALISEQAQSEQMQLEFTLLREWMDVIIANLLKHLRRYQVDDQIAAIEARFAAAVGDDDQTSKPKELVAMLESYIQIMLDIVDDLETKTFAIKQKEIGGDLREQHDLSAAASNNNKQNKSQSMKSGKINTINENEAFGLDSAAAASDGLNNRGSKKKTRKSKYAK